jgi:hypothetical protein
VDELAAFCFPFRVLTVSIIFKKTMYNNFDDCCTCSSGTGFVIQGENRELARGESHKPVTVDPLV